MPFDVSIQNKWILGESVPGVRFKMCQSVRVVAGEHSGKLGELISLCELDPDPIFHLETSDGGDAKVSQSQIEAFDW
jgi:hypothetical protein